jgi:hypothetical protein
MNPNASLYMSCACEGGLSFALPGRSGSIDP